jgi:hypothetical protein
MKKAPFGRAGPFSLYPSPKISLGEASKRYKQGAELGVQSLAAFIALY